MPDSVGTVGAAAANDADLAGPAAIKVPEASPMTLLRGIALAALASGRATHRRTVSHAGDDMLVF